MISKTLTGKKETLVMKFGGTSVGTPEAMRQVVSIVAAEKKNWRNLVVITSALSGVTDLLIDMASGKADLMASAAILQNRHREIADVLIHDQTAREQALLLVNKIIDQILPLKDL